MEKVYNSKEQLLKKFYKDSFTLVQDTCRQCKTRFDINQSSWLVMCSDVCQRKHQDEQFMLIRLGRNI